MSQITSKSSGGVVPVTVVETLTGNSGGAVGPTGNNINVIGSGAISVAGNPGTSTLTISEAGSVATTYTENSGSATPAAGNLNVLGSAGITTSGAGSTITITAGVTIPTTFTEDAGTATPALNNLNIRGGTGIATSGAGSTVTISTASSVSNSFPTDSGTATPVAGVLDILGAGGVTTSGAGNVVTVTAGATIPTTFTEDSGTATPALNNINMLGAHGINTLGSGSTVTTAINNTITLGDLSPVGAGSPSVTLTTGDLLVSAGNVDLPTTTSTAGQVTINSQPFVHNFGSVRNTFVGANAGNFTLSSVAHTAIGQLALNSLTNGGNSNSAFGDFAGFSITSGSGNVCFGQAALETVITGSENVAIGHAAASQLNGAESNNIIIANDGTNYVGGSGNIVLGTPGTHTACNISGIYGVTPSAGGTQIAVIDMAGNLGSSATGGGSIMTITGDTGGAESPSAGNFNLLGAHGINTAGSAATETIAINNTVTLGDLAVVTAGNSSLTLTSGDLTVSGTGASAGGNINIPATSSANVGVVNQNSLPLLHTYNDGKAGANLFLGQNAGNFTLAPVTNDSRNVGIGNGALGTLTTGILNSCVGSASGVHITSGIENVALGLDSLGGSSVATTGNANAAIGTQSLLNATSATANCALGSNVLDKLTTGSNNIGIGGSNGVSGLNASPLRNLLTGSNNIAIGGFNGTASTAAGVNYTGAESSNICLGGATVGTLGESNVMRLGTSGSGAGQVNTAFIAGTYGVTPAVSGTNQMVISNDQGQFGTQTIPTGAMTWTVITGATQSLVANNGYIANRGAGVAFALPATAAIGDTFSITNINAGGWSLTQAAGQQIFIGNTNTTLGAGGSLASTALGDTITLICTVVNTTFQVISMIGNVTVV